MAEEFGFEIPEEELRASDVRSALSSTQGFDPGFLSTRELIVGGPQAFARARAGADARRKIAQERAEQGLRLAGQALSLRDRQQKLLRDQGDRERHDEFLQKVEGLSPAEAVHRATPEDISNPLTSNFLRQFDALDIARQQAVRRGIMEPVLQDPETQEAIQRGEKISAQINALKNDQALSDLSDNHDGRLRAYDIAAEGGLFRSTDDPASQAHNRNMAALIDMMEQDESGEVRKNLKHVSSAMSEWHKASAATGEDPAQFDRAMQAAVAELVETGSLSNESVMQISVARQRAQEVVQNKERKRQVIEQLLNQARAYGAALETADDGSIRDQHRKLVISIDQISRILREEMEAAEEDGVQVRGPESLGRLSTTLQQMEQDLQVLGQQLSSDKQKQRDTARAKLAEKVTSLQGEILKQVESPAPSQTPITPAAAAEGEPAPLSPAQVGSHEVFGN